MGLEDLLRELVQRRGSDLHLSGDRPPYLRLNGELQPWGEALGSADLLAQVLPLVPAPLRDRYATDKELDFAVSLADGSRFRVNLYRERGQPAVAFRALSQEMPEFESLQLPTVLGDCCDRPRGLVLVTGPTGSGKSTTLAACLNRINARRRGHVITIEDPIEYLFRDDRCLIHQRELGQDTNSFARALRAALREDPDVIMVGEMRDLETIQLAITAAETGHLVLSTLHTRSAATTVDRIVDVFPGGQQAQIRVQLSNSLLAICSQTLCRRADGAGRRVATELLVSTGATANLIREGQSAQLYSVLQSGADDGMHTLEQELARLVRQGQISPEEALRHSSRPQELQTLGVPMPPSELNRSRGNSLGDCFTRPRTPAR